MTEGLKIEFPSFGWRQMLTARHDILATFDRARNQSKAHEVETYHGRAAEAAVRKWLSEFLPARYGVTSGYVVSPGLPSSARAPHFDVIIYDRLEAPVLWVEDNPDMSSAGRSLAVPVEHVHAVLEVKSQLTIKTARNAVEHLADLKPLMQAIDEPNERYKLHLPPGFVCGAIFVDLREAASSSASILPQFIEGAALRGYFGGLVLRGEGHTMPHTGKITLLQSEQEIEEFPREGKAQLLEYGLAQSIKVTEKLHLSAMLMWSEAGFAQFGFDLLAMMRGTYEPGRLSSFYGMGHSFVELFQAE
jgi:hypothetical protein